MEAFAAYGHAIVALAASGALGLVISLLTGMQKVKLGLPPGASPDPDYANPAYRWHRAQLNMAETMGFFTAVTVAAVLAGASPFWVNLLAALFFVSRAILAVVHVTGVGKPDMSLRSFLYGLGWAICILLAILAVIGALT
ncbi:MAPEG family protein [Roseovarius sp. SYSU LYC5161]|uniref:MAPEG family protein n=1 Tax=Roseovarius halophilus (ex Wu et al. 2025) TaxID=3376060 RepID=UPI00399BDFDE